MMIVAYMRMNLSLVTQKVSVDLVILRVCVLLWSVRVKHTESRRRSTRTNTLTHAHSEMRCIWHRSAVRMQCICVLWVFVVIFYYYYFEALSLFNRMSTATKHKTCENEWIKWFATAGTHTHTPIFQLIYRILRTALIQRRGIKTISNK